MGNWRRYDEYLYVEMKKRNKYKCTIRAMFIMLKNSRESDNVNINAVKFVVESHERYKILLLHALDLDGTLKTRKRMDSHSKTFITRFMRYLRSTSFACE